MTDRLTAFYSRIVVFELNFSRLLADSVLRKILQIAFLAKASTAALKDYLS